MEEKFAHMQGPCGVITLNKLSSSSEAEEGAEYYGPVPFDHTAHAKWAEIGEGCATCHHYTPEGAKTPSCRTCHQTGHQNHDMRKPGLKGAYHRQCLGCHREWGSQESCGVCHTKRQEGIPSEAGAQIVTKDDLIGTLHPPIPEPVEDSFETAYPAGSTTRVYFNHQRHVQGYEIKCAECHRGDACVRCHDYENRQTTAVPTLKEHHKPCIVCHPTEGKCNECHRREDQGPPPAFHHSSTGWPLASRHGTLGCRSCHKDIPYRPLDPECTACHGSWAVGSFAHGEVTNLKLDEVHAEVDCEYCHLEGKYGEPPTCSECHDDRSYPEDLPGLRGTFSAR